MKTTELLRDALIVAGAALIVAGLWQIWCPLGADGVGPVAGRLAYRLGVGQRPPQVPRRAGGPIHPIRNL